MQTAYKELENHMQILNDKADHMSTVTPLGTNQSGMRAYNEKLVLSILRKDGALAKAEIAKRTGLSAQTVSVIMRELEKGALLTKGDPVRGKVGQPSVPMSLNPEGAFFFGLKIGRRSCEVALVDFVGEVRETRRLRHDYPVADDIFEFAMNAIVEIEAVLGEGERSRISGLGIAMPFELWNWAKLIGKEQSELAHWKERDLAHEFQNTLAYPVYLQNDASAACGAELTFSSNPLPSNFLYIYIGYFVGGGIVLGDRLFTGPSGNAGALGPIPVQNSSGKMVQLIETSSIANLEWALIERGIDTRFMWEVGADWDIPQEILEPWLNECASGLLQATLASISVIDFEAVLVDGWMHPSLKKALVVKLENMFKDTVVSGSKLPELIEGSMGSKARVMGAASLPLFDQFMVDY